MAHQAFVGERIDAELVTDTLHVRDRTREEVPRGRIGLPLAGVLREHFRRIASRVECDGQQGEIASELRLKALAKGAEVVGDAQAEVRQRATGVDEVYGNDLPAQMGERYLPSLL